MKSHIKTGRRRNTDQSEPKTLVWKLTSGRDTTLTEALPKE